VRQAHQESELSCQVQNYDASIVAFHVCVTCGPNTQTSADFLQLAQQAQSGSGQHDDAGERVLAVAFGSAPGVPNWGGLLARVSKVAQDAAQECFDVLFVVDPGRSWYSGGAFTPLLLNTGTEYLGYPVTKDPDAACRRTSNNPLTVLC
jgi:hypothetical protein